MSDWRSRLRHHIEQSGRTRAQICQSAGLNQAYLTQILEQKGATPRIDNLSKIAKVLDTSVSHLVDGVTLDAKAREALASFQQLDPARQDAALMVLRDMAHASKEAAADDV